MVEIAALFFGAPQLHADLFLCHRLPVMEEMASIRHLSHLKIILFYIHID